MAKWSHDVFIPGSLIVLLGLVHVGVFEPSEPFFNNDETRHVMTGVLFRDLFIDVPLTTLRQYAMTYYLQYPALGLLIWPPFFYVIEGLVMAVFGTSMIVPKILIGLFTAMACLYLFLLARWTHDRWVAGLSVLIFGASPIVFRYSQQVMLEIPTLTLGLAATYHFLRYLAVERPRQLYLAALLSSCAALTRYSAIYLLPVFLILLIVRKRWDILSRRESIVSILLALALVLPFYALSSAYSMGGQLRLAIDGIQGSATGVLSLEALLFYPASLPTQLGWYTLASAMLGLLCSLTRGRRKPSLPYWAIMIAVYLVFTPMAIWDPRYVIYWVPAFAVFAADGLAIVSSWLRIGRFRYALAAVISLGTLATALSEPIPFVRGYARAAHYVLPPDQSSRFYLFDGMLDGNFIYYIRRHDPHRTLWVLRGDKLLYTFHLFAHLDYAEIAKTAQEILDTIYKFDPEFIIVEEPQHSLQRTAISDLLRDVLNRYPDRFVRETTIPVESNVPEFREMTLEIYRNTFRNPFPDRTWDLKLQGGQRLQSTSRMGPGAPAESRRGDARDPLLTLQRVYIK